MPGESFPPRPSRRRSLDFGLVKPGADVVIAGIAGEQRATGRREWVCRRGWIVSRSSPGVVCRRDVCRGVLAFNDVVGVVPARWCVVDGRGWAWRSCWPSGRRRFVKEREVRGMDTRMKVK